jgi:hypothetical protein
MAPTVVAIRPRGGAGPRTAFVRLTANRVTAFGPAWVYALATAQDSIFAAGLEVARTDRGCVRYCSVTLDDVATATTPQRYECQPDLALQENGLFPPPTHDPQVAAIAGRVTPRFTARSYDMPGYAQLSAACAPEIGHPCYNGATQRSVKPPRREDPLAHG